MQLSRRKFLKGLTATGAVARVGLPPLAAMFNFNGTAYAADAATAAGRSCHETRRTMRGSGQRS